MDEENFGAAPPELVAWFASHARDLPWRGLPAGGRDPWATVVSEVMSQQTRLEVVVPRFREWMLRFPDPESLARSQEEEVLALWAGLGYYARARALLRLSREVAASGWPSDAAGLRRLPGIGPYTAAAIASLCYGEAVAALDGNVERVLARYHALAGELRRGAGRRRLEVAAAAWVAGEEAGRLNEATMELGALVCLPRGPRCESCPLGESCRCRGAQAERFPEPRERPESVAVLQTAFVLEGPEGILLRRGTGEDPLAGFWTLPVAPGRGVSILPAPYRTLAKGALRACGKAVRHAITFRRIVWDVASAPAAGKAPEGHRWCPRQELSREIVSSLPRKALQAAGAWDP